MKKTDLNIIQTNWVEEAKSLTEIRFKVFVNEQGVPAALEIDEHDNEATHFLVFTKQSDKPIATARLLKNGHIGRMAVLKPFRGQCVGFALLKFIINTAREMGINQLFLNAQTSASEFYGKAGFVKTGEVFLDAGIPHIKMFLNN